MKATAEVDKFAVIWHMASVLARKKYKVLPDRAKIAELDIKLEVLFADQEDMTSSQRRQLDAIAQAFEAMDSAMIEQEPDTYEPGTEVRLERENGRRSSS